MLRLLTVVLLATTAATAQTTPKTTKPGSVTNTMASRASTPPTGGPASKSAAKLDRPIPEQPLRTKLRNANTTNPNYNREKDLTARGTRREYNPRRTASGARKDTLNQRRPGDPVEN